MSSPPPLSVLAFGAWDRGPGYPRADALLEGLRQQGVTVRECYFELPGAGAHKRDLVGAPWRWPRYFFSLRRARGQAVRQLSVALEAHPVDVLLVPYPGHVTVPWARSVFGGPIVLDLFLSAYDTAVGDRRMFHPLSPLAWVLKRLDTSACRAADLVLVDTPQQAEHLETLLSNPMDWVPVSDPDERPQPLPYPDAKSGERLEVLFFGTGVPLHGLETLLRAVEQVEPLRLTLIGGGAEDRARAERLGPARVRVLERFVPPATLRHHLEQCHLVAGIFGTGDKAQRVVPLKVMLALSAGRPVLTADTPAVRGLLRPGMDCLVVPPGDSAALADELRQLAAEPQRLRPLAAAARHAYERHFSLARTGARLAKLCRSLANIQEPRSHEATEATVLTGQ